MFKLCLVSLIPNINAQPYNINNAVKNTQFIKYNRFYTPGCEKLDI